MSADTRELYSLLIPLAEQRLIVPRACVAEVIGFQPPGVEPDGPVWYFGSIDWNGRSIPIASFEGACGDRVPATSGGRTRIVVFYAIAGKLRSGYFGVVTQGFPQLVRVNPDVIHLDEERHWSEAVPVVCSVKMANEKPLIPDLDRLESMLADEVE